MYPGRPLKSFQMKACVSTFTIINKSRIVKPKAQVQSQVQVPNPGPKSRSQIQSPKSKVLRKGTKTGADTIILQATHPTSPHHQ